MGAAGEAVESPARSDRPKSLHDSHVRRRRRPTVPPLAEVAPELVVLVSVDDRFTDLFTRRVEPRAEVKRVEGMLDLLGLIETRPKARTAIVVDCALPSIAPPSLASMAHLLPRTCDVILWGIPPRQRGRFFRSYPVAVEWAACGPNATLDNLLEHLFNE